jgi:hypothetical protein
LGEIYKLETKMAHLGGGRIGRRIDRSMEIIDIDDLKYSNVKIGKEDDQLLWSLNPSRGHMCPN